MTVFFDNSRDHFLNFVTFKYRKINWFLCFIIMAKRTGFFKNYIISSD